MIAIAKRGRGLNFDFINKDDNFEKYKIAIQQASISNFEPMIELFRRLDS